MIRPALPPIPSPALSLDSGNYGSSFFLPRCSFRFKPCLIITNTTTLGADLAGVAEAIGMVSKTPYVWWVAPIAFLLWMVVVFKGFRVIERYLFLLSFVFLAYLVSGVLSRPSWAAVASAVARPKIEFSFAYLLAGVGLLGTTITPFLFFWQAKQGTEEKNSHQELALEAKHEDKLLAPGFIYSNLISLFIMIASAQALYGKNSIFVISAADAAQALTPVAGQWATSLFALGIIGAGFLAVPVLAASTAYAVAETFGWRDSLSDKPNKAKGFYTVLTAAVIAGIGIAVSGVAPMGNSLTVGLTIFLAGSRWFS